LARSAARSETARLNVRPELATRRHAEGWRRNPSGNARAAWVHKPTNVLAGPPKSQQ
jgi:hypothetical protein